MRCTTCDYSLWNLRSRLCPECGTPFAPSAYRFVPESVCFNCPHCDQTYYGTGADGHLDPRSFRCVRCERDITMDEMVLAPADGVDEGRTEADVVPWLEPRRRFFSRWLATIGMAIGSPVRLMRALPREAPAGKAMWFGVLTNSVYMAMGMGVFFLIPMAIGGVVGGRSGLLGAALLLGAIVVVPLLVSAATILAWAGATHLLLRLSGPTEEPFGRTLSAMGYGSAANVLLAVPCLGFYLLPFAWIWWGITAAIMVREGQRVSPVRAGLAVFAPATVVVVAAGVVLVSWMMGVQSNIATAMANAPRTVAQQTVGEAQTAAMLGAILDYAADSGGDGPPHALALVLSDGLGAADFHIGAPPLPPGGTHWIDAVAAAQPDRQGAMIDRTIGSLPDGVVAHRVGEFVFTYHGIDLSPGSGADGGLWVVVGFPPAGVLGPGPSPFVFAGCADGSTAVIPVGQFGAQWVYQNTLRGAAGLPPIPDPRTVTETNAAAAEPGGEG